MEELRKDRSTLPYQCLCPKRYPGYQSLHTHIRLKHNNDPLYKQHLETLNKQIVREKKERSKQIKPMTMKDIDSNPHDLKKLGMLDRTILAIYEAYKPANNRGFYLDLSQTNEEDHYEEDSRGGPCKNDEDVEQEEIKLIQKYDLAQLFETSPPIYQEFQYEAAPDENGKQGKFILMKKQLAQFFSMQWAPKFHLQLDIYAALRRSKPQGELAAKVQKCSRELWGKYAKMGQILMEYYEELMRKC